ncbi:MAG: bifunctional homocysteine S-methyltransferase/methylenetetrahydrofolate reductase [Acidobacteria bacterium]|nr:bifunctional homocysteine S-methyltransferase/methylenetetrahydrofolate reductase [Acidobacteriota bacterium]MBI1983675.1 bifunctional homocysteine S-methyltransferase/methylenetetrahydrofolate reductase [Acidobacteriota bacterium]
MREPFLKRLEKRIVVADGAMGTMLYSKGIPLNRCFDELSLTMPQVVKDIHLGYVKAGAEVIETNTFGATRFRLQKFDRGDRVREINLAGARLAREVAGEDLYVAGSVGPLGLRLEPLGPTSLEEAREIFREQIEALLEGGVDLIIVETMTDLNEAHQALLAARDAGPLPVVVQMTIQDEGATLTGTQPEDFTRQLDAWGADLIGINCSVGPAGVLEALERMAAVTTKKLSAQPNAGLPRTIEGRNFYLSSPEYLASYARRFIQAGARLVGGCCGTTPEHIKAIKAAVRSLAPQPPRAAVEVSSRPARPQEPVPVEKRSRLAEKLWRGEFPVLVEIVPPKGCDPTKEIEGAQYLQAHGVETVNVPDGTGATARMSALTMAAVLQQRVGVEVLLHYSSRDRNVLTIQSDLLGAHALGVRNLLALTRDAAQYSTILESEVFEVDAIGLVNIVNNLNRGLDVGSNPLGTQTSFLIAVGANPCALNLNEEIRRFEYKVEAGANLAVTQPVFDVKSLGRFLRRAESFAIPVVASIWPLTSYRNAEFMNNEVPGVSVPPEVMERMRKADTGDRARAEGVRIAQETLLEVRQHVQGVQIAAPFGRYAMAVEVAQILKERAKV